MSALRAILAAAAVVLASTAQAQPASPEQWRDAASRDLTAIHATIADDTPVGAHVAGGAYETWLDRGYSQAQARVPQVHDRASYFYALTGYVNGFHDPHFSLSSSQTIFTPRWPGFIASRHASEFLVAWRDATDASAPPLGARIASCDGQSLDALIERDVNPFAVDATLPENQRRAAPRLFLDTNNPFVSLPHSCVFETPTGSRTLTLAWRALPSPPGPFLAAFGEAELGASAQFGLSEPAPGVAWIGAASFAQDGQATPALGALFNELQQQGNAIRSGRAIVIDLRGNAGGNVEMARRLAQLVFGVDTIARLPPSDTGGGVLWRVSARNLAYWRDNSDQAQRTVNVTLRTGAQSRDIVQGLQRALDRHEPTWQQGDNGRQSGGLTQRRPHGAGPFPARVYLLSNGSCAGACLDFADMVLQIPGTSLIGAPTSADTLLTGTRSIALPSGEASFTFPQKLLLGRGRGALEFYAPDVAYTGDWSDASVRAWALGVVQQHAPTR